MCTPRASCPCWPTGLVGGLAASPRPFPCWGNSRSQTCEAKKALTEAAGPPRLPLFFRQLKWKPAPGALGLVPPTPSPRFSEWPSRRRDRCCQQDGPAGTSTGVCTHKRTLTPSAWPGGVAPERRIWRLHAMPTCWAPMEPWRLARPCRGSPSPTPTRVWPTGLRGQVVPRTLAQISLPSSGP